MASWYDSPAFHLHMLLKESQQSKVESDGFFLLSLYYTNNVLLSFVFLSLFLSLFLFISAASDHYLIGNNITVAVLGIVIPIGEYSWLPRCVAFCFLPACFSLLASPSLLVAGVLQVVGGCGILYVWLYVCVHLHVCVTGFESVCTPIWLIKMSVF